MFLCLIVFILNIATKGQEVSNQGKLSITIFGDYSYNIQRDTLSTTLNYAVLNDANNLNGFNFRRLYLTYNYKFDRRFSTKIGFDSD